MSAAACRRVVRLEVFAVLALALVPGAQEPAPEPAADEPPSEQPTPADTGEAPPAAEVVVPAPSEPMAGSTPPPAPTPVHPVVSHPLSLEALSAHVHGIAEAHPEVATLEVLGRSSAGREILALRLAAPGETPDARRPALLLLDHHGPASAGPEAMLALAWELASRFEDDAEVRALLGAASLVLAPALDPDARAEAMEGLALGASPSEGGVESVLPASAPRAIRFERNFPSGWQPETLRPGSGRVSLGLPEALAAARYLAGLRSCAVVLGFVPLGPRGKPYPHAELPDADRAVFAQLAQALAVEGARPLVPWPELDTGGGGPLDYAYQARGMYPLAFQLPGPDELAAGWSAFAADVRARALRCLALLPRIEIVQEGLERVAADTWQLDVRVRNAGLVPTTSALARRREPGADVALELSGARLVATAQRPDDGAAFVDPSLEVRIPVTAGTLAGGEGRALRLLLEAAPGTTPIVVRVSSPWAGTASVSVPLP